MPGAISTSSSPIGVSRKTQRSVTKSTAWLRRAACSPLKVRCSTSSTNLHALPSLSIRSLPPATSTVRSPARNVRRDHFLRILADVDEAACAGQSRAELADVQIAVPVHLRQSQQATSNPPPS